MMVRSSVRSGAASAWTERRAVGVRMGARNSHAMVKEAVGEANESWRWMDWIK